MMNDPLGDMIVRIYNAQMRNKSKVSTPASKLRQSVLDVLKNEGFIRGYAAVEHASGRKEIEIELKYFDGEPVIREISRVSKPGRRVYASVRTLPRVNNGLGVAILSTPKGVMADHEARDNNVGGEIRGRIAIQEEIIMSRVGKKPVPIPSGVTATLDGQLVKVKGPKGELSLMLHGDVEAKLAEREVQVDPRMDTKRARAMWGTYRSLLAQVVEGVTKGFERRLEINGVGYRATLQGKNLQIQLGYSHDIVYPIPDGIMIAVPRPTEIVVSGIDGQKVGHVAAVIRGFRKPEPYKGKGVKYAGEYIFRKEGKKK
jgi:large subunit ribosomal protein L6